MMSRQQLARTYQPITTSLQQIQELKEKEDIVIKPADKGSAVVMDNVDYLEEANRKLTDERLYKKLDSDLTEEFSNKITQELKIMKENSHIDKNTFDYLKPDNLKLYASIYYLQFIKSSTPGDPLFQEMGIPQKNLRIRRFPPSTSCRSATLTFQRHH